MHCHRQSPPWQASVFLTKFTEFIRDVTERKTFGDVLNYSYVIEFHKRGLPHAHVVFTLRAEGEFADAEAIDELISAEKPDRYWRRSRPGLWCKAVSARAVRQEQARRRQYVSVPRDSLNLPSTTQCTTIAPSPRVQAQQIRKDVHLSRYLRLLHTQVYKDIWIRYLHKVYT